jgi:small subunit ribosomal protein S8
MNSTLINFLIAIKNASFYKKEQLKIFYKKKFILLSKILYKQGLIQDFWLQKEKLHFYIIIGLKYNYNFSNLKNLKLISKPSRAIFFSFKDIFKIYEKQIFYIFSTSLGYLTSLECKQKKIGGFLFFYT